MPNHYGLYEEPVQCRTCNQWVDAYTDTTHVQGWGTVKVHRRKIREGEWNEHTSPCDGGGKNVKLELQQAILI